MKLRFEQWLRKKLLRLLDLPETYIGADFDYHGDTTIVMVRKHRGGKCEVIGDWQYKNKPYGQMLRDVEALARNYNVQQDCVVIDKPYGFGL